jgi:hypothetical protein
MQSTPRCCTVSTFMTCRWREDMMANISRGKWQSYLQGKRLLLYPSQSKRWCNQLRQVQVGVALGITTNEKCLQSSRRGVGHLSERARVFHNVSEPPSEVQASQPCARYSSLPRNQARWLSLLRRRSFLLLCLRSSCCKCTAEVAGKVSAYRRCQSSHA